MAIACGTTKLKLNLYSILRYYSVFPPDYIKPIYKKNEQQSLYESNEIRTLQNKNIKPPMTEDTCSEFHDELVKKFTNYIMRKGKKLLARSLIEKTFENIKRIQLTQYHSSDPERKKQIELDPKQILYKAVENCTPVLELSPVRKGGITYQIPVPLNPNRARFLSMNWLIRSAKNKEHKMPLPDQLAKELIEASHNQGRVVKKKLDLHKQCNENRAYAHYRWT